MSTPLQDLARGAIEAQRRPDEKNERLRDALKEITAEAFGALALLHDAYQENEELERLPPEDRRHSLASSWEDCPTCRGVHPKLAAARDAIAASGARFLP